MKVTNEKHNDWDMHLHPILFAYRVSMQSSTKQTPFEMMFGAKPRLPISLDQPTGEAVDPMVDHTASLKHRLMEVSEELLKIRASGLAHLKVAQQEQKRRYDAKHQGTYYDVGDLVS